MNNTENVVDILTPDEQKELLNIARRTIESVTKHDPPHVPLEYQYTIFDEKYGAFVTLHIAGQLRGCIGYVNAVKPLAETIVEMAEAAALRDPRFEPVKESEVPELNIEISVLTPMEKISGVEQIKIGQHGLYIEKGFHRGLLLPQVASEQQWDTVKFLQQTCLKAGLNKDEWQDPNSDINIFSAQIFRE